MIVWLASRSDIQGVAAGVLPNLIDIKAAIETCKEAVQRYPEIGRFSSSWRALYADGQYQKAEEQLVQAKDQGHVRAAQLLGRFYQLGLNGKADPRAVPLFEQERRSAILTRNIRLPARCWPEMASNPMSSAAWRSWSRVKYPKYDKFLVSKKTL